MTKRELISKLQNVPDDYIVVIWVSKETCEEIGCESDLFAATPREVVVDEVGKSIDFVTGKVISS